MTTKKKKISDFSVKKRSSQRGNKASKVRLTKGWTIGFFLTVLSILGTFLTLVGFGVATAASDIFGMPHESLFGSPFELLELSAWAVQQFFIGMEKDLIWSQLYTLVLMEVWPFVIYIFILGSIAIIISKSNIKNINAKNVVSYFFLGFLVAQPLMIVG